MTQLADLKNLKQLGTLQDYLDAFDALYPKVGHKCKKWQAFVMQVIVDEGEDSEEMGEEEFRQELQLSPTTLKGTHGAQTMCIQGCSGKLQLQLLIDTGNNHNFLGAHIAKKLSCEKEPITGVLVDVANGQNTQCQAKGSSFKWQIQDHYFEADVFLLPLDNYDLILGP
ncbi:hypothetical protein GH714_029730 [Hevea brasiliensis]|uniref:Retrotransposon gag domain-containing protein n=1 Tax=Hevea brasiliensis TaxID=3981 RepID=A0A6A6M1K7_HEVBR|nr:hypothetical protein GH714_029730 [Hevea brasiliensis]